MRWCSTTAFGVFLIASGVPASRAEEGVNLGRLTWTAFQCSVFAELSGNKVEQERLFTLGYATGKRLLEGLRSGTFSEADLKDAPFVFSLLLGGPTVDFMLGRIYESATGYAYDSVTKSNNDGTTNFDPTKWITDDGIKSIIAGNRYSQANCELIH